MSDREKLLKKLSGAQFAAYEMQLYLDTHKKDRKALRSMAEYLDKAKMYKKEYEEKYGPLTADDIYGDTRFKWVNAPWPWENEKEAL